MNKPLKMVENLCKIREQEGVFVCQFYNIFMKHNIRYVARALKEIHCAWPQSNELTVLVPHFRI